MEKNNLSLLEHYIVHIKCFADKSCIFFYQEYNNVKSLPLSKSYTSTHIRLQNGYNHWMAD